jgi:biopolymer transport protein TolQ
MTQSIAAPVEGVNAEAVEGTLNASGFAAGASGHDVSLVGLFLNAEPLVLCIMLLLVTMSVLSWAIIFQRYAALKTIAAKTRAFEREFWSSDSLEKLYEKLKRRKATHPMALIFTAGMEEFSRGSTGADKPALAAITNKSTASLTISTRERIGQMMTVTCNREVERMEAGLGFLATVGSSAPFVGLLGTCIGIMNSFRAIAGAQNTSLAIVAPGIAEALLATTIGLAVAIPAVVAYNRFSGEVNSLAGRFEDFTLEFHTMLSRQTEGQK